jgi:hypothetical protein
LRNAVSAEGIRNRPAKAAPKRLIGAIAHNANSTGAAEISFGNPSRYFTRLYAYMATLVSRGGIIEGNLFLGQTGR